MENKGRSEPGFFGTIHHYDEYGNKTGTSEPGLFGGYDHYDSHGNKTGHSDPGFLGGYIHRDASGQPAGSSSPGGFGSYHHSDGDYAFTYYARNIGLCPHMKNPRFYRGVTFCWRKDRFWSSCRFFAAFVYGRRKEKYRAKVLTRTLGDDI